MPAKKPSLISWFLRLSLALAAAGCNGTATAPAPGPGPEVTAAPADDELFVVVAQPLVNTGGNFGVYAPDSYQDGWLRVWSFNDTATGFANRMDRFASRAFKWGLRGSAPYIVDGADQYGGTDSVDVLWLGTHGGISDWGDLKQANWAMWDRDDHIYTTQLRPGDGGRQNKLFISYACDTLRDDRDLFTRWHPVLNAGVKLVAGYTDTIYVAEGTDDIGRDFAQNLRDEDTIADAWDDAANLWLHPQTPALIAAGRDRNDCRNRLMNSRYNDLLSSSSLPRLAPRDQVYYCVQTF
jgi:hypothetical protein